MTSDPRSGSTSRSKARIKPPSRARFGRNVVVLGLVSLLTDVSSEMLYPIIPLYLTSVLGAPMSVVGLIEGLAESTASLLKLVSGVLSDRYRRRLPWLYTGYGLSTLSRPLLALAGTWPILLAARLLDRAGKGLRGPPRDAMLAASVSPERRGMAFGLHRAMDTTGAVAGPLLGILLLNTLGLSYRAIFLVAAVPSVMAVASLGLLRPTRGFAAARAASEGEGESSQAVRAGADSISQSRSESTPSPAPSSQSSESPPAESTPPAAIFAASPELRSFLWVSALFALGNSSNVFLLLRARQLGLDDMDVLWLYVLYNLIYAIAATPLGALSDRIGRHRVLVAGFVAFAFVYGAFGLIRTPVWTWPLMCLYGLYAAATSGVARAYVADLSTGARRATAMGLYQTINGALLLAASLLAGWLWSTLGPHAPFVLGAVMALAAAAVLAATTRIPRGVSGAA